MGMVDPGKGDPVQLILTQPTGGDHWDVLV